MQDRSRQFDEIFLRRTAGPYIRVTQRKVVTLLLPCTLPADAAAFGSDIGKVPERKSRGLFDHFGGLHEQRRRHVQSERPGGLEIDDQLKLAWLQNWQIGGLRAF